MSNILLLSNCKYHINIQYPNQRYFWTSNKIIEDIQQNSNPTNNILDYIYTHLINVDRRFFHKSFFIYYCDSHCTHCNRDPTSVYRMIDKDYPLECLTLAQAVNIRALTIYLTTQVLFLEHFGHVQRRRRQYQYPRENGFAQRSITFNCYVLYHFLKQYNFQFLE